MKSYDAIIIGGGPAGSSCAWKLCEAGSRVLVLDKKLFPRNKPCAGWITPQVVQALQLDIDAYRAEHVWQPITGFRCGTLSGKQIECRYDEPVSFGIRRCEFDAFLLKRSGAECRLGEPANELARQPNGWTINGSYSAPMLVGAGGHFCPVARWLHARVHSSASIVRAQEVEFYAPLEAGLGNVAADTPELYFCDDMLGYGWCFRKNDYLNIGLGRTDPQHLSKHVAGFCEFLRRHKRVGCEIPDRFVGHAYQLYEREVPKLFDRDVVLIGDAAGLAHSQSGEGIRPAVESGLIAASVILAAGGKYGREQLGEFERRLICRLGRPTHGISIPCVPAAWLSAAAARLLGTRWFSRDVVLDRWFLHRKQSPLVA